MKQLLLLTLFIPALLWAQEDSKYLAGAVPVENGKVVFAKEINAPSFSKDEVYDRMLDWADGFFSEDGNRVVYSDKAKGDIAAVGQANLVFQSTALSLDRTEMNYRVTMECENQKCVMKVAGIRYEYNVSYQREPEKYTAEEWITDKYCLNKDKTKLNRGNGKFRRKTVDFIDEMFASASAALGAQVAANVVPATPVTPARTVTPAQATQPATPVPAKEGYVAFAADKVPSTLLQMLPESDMQVASAGKPDTKETSAQWKGTGNMFGKSIASIAISKDSPVYKEIDNNDTYSLSFFKKGENGDAWLIIDCRKQGETAEGGQITVIGEIINVWMK